MMATSAGNGLTPRVRTIKISLFNSRFSISSQFTLEVVQELVQGRPEILWRVRKYATRPHVAHRDPRPAQHFEQVQDPFPAAERVHQRRAERAQLLHEEAHRDQVARDPLQLRRQRPQILSARRRLDPQQLFHRQAVRLVVDHGRRVIQAVRQGHHLYVVPFLGQLFGAPVQVAQHRLDLNDVLAVERYPYPEHAVRARMLRSNVDRHRFGADRHRGRSVPRLQKNPCAADARQTLPTA